MDDLKRTAMLLEAHGVDALDTTLPAKAPESASRLLAVMALPKLSIGDRHATDLELREVIGEGGMGIVNLAEQRALGREVAVKRLRAHLADNAGAAWLLIDEARITGELEHPNIAPIHTIGVDEANSPVMVMKRLFGKVWRDVMHDETHTLPAGARDLLGWNLETLMQVCNAASFAHSRGVLHRDIKPENVMVGEHGEVYLLDWGAALRLQGMKHSEAIVGTLAYMAPEMLRGAGPHLTPATDVYLLGATLHELLTGEAPHAAENVQGALASICRSHVGAYPDWVPRELVDLCHRSLSANPEDRPASALAFKQAIADYVRHRGSIDIARAATQRLGKLLKLCGEFGKTRRDQTDPRVTNINQLYIECAFGYRQALEAWSENEEARAGLQEGIETMIRFELNRRNPEAAATLLSQLAEPRDDLRHAVEKLRGEMDDEGRELARLRNVAQEQDPTIASRARAGSAIATGVVLFALFMILARFYPGAEGLTHRTIAIVTLLLGAGLAGTTVMAREKMLANAINRYLSATMFGIVLTILAVHVAGLLASAPVTYALVADLLISGAVVATVGFNIHRGMLLVGLVYLVGALAAAAAQHLVLQVMAATFLLSHLALAWTWRMLAGAKPRAAPRTRS